MYIWCKHEREVIIPVLPAHLLYGIAFLFIVAGLAWGKHKPIHIFGIAVLFLILTGEMDVNYVYSAAVNPAILTIMALVLTTTLVKGRIHLEGISKYLPKSKLGFLISTTTLTSVLSGFMNNTPLVALLIPMVKEVSAHRKWNPSLFLLPISYAAVVGGMLTVIGTSTNLVLNGLIIGSELKPFGFWDFFAPGVVVLTGVLMVLWLVSSLILGKLSESKNQQQLSIKHYTTELKVIPGGNIEGETVESVGFKKMRFLYLAEIYRQGTVIAPVSPKEVLRAGDSLFFTGELDHVNDLMDKHQDGLQTVEQKFGVSTRNDLLEALVPNNSSVIGQEVKKLRFREKYDAAIVGVHRNGQSLQGKIGRIRLLPGDLLLLAPGPRFQEINSETNSFTLLQQHQRQNPKKIGKGKFFIPAAALIVTGAIWLQLNFLLTLGLILTAAIALGLTHSEKLKQEFNIQLYSLLVLSVSFGAAMHEGGHMEHYLSFIDIPSSNSGKTLMLFGITLVLTNFMTNVSAVAIAFPIASAMISYDYSQSEAFLTVAFAASAAFLTPTSYQTHLMVMGPGNYSNKHFWKMGLPVLIVYSCLFLLYTAFKY